MAKKPEKKGFRGFNGIRQGDSNEREINSRKLKAVPRLDVLMGLPPPGQVVEAVELVEQQAQQVEQALKLR